MQHKTYKNIVYGSINAGGNIHIGDITYNAEQDFSSSILFLRIERQGYDSCRLNLSIKSKQVRFSQQATPVEKLLNEAVQVTIPKLLIDAISQFQQFRRSIDGQMRGLAVMKQISIADRESQLSKLLFDTFFSGDIGQVCTDFIQLLEESRIKELMMVVSTDDDDIANLPFEMVLPLLFPPKLGQAKKSLAATTFELVRTKVSSLSDFQLQGDHATPAPLKMLFVTALPENLDERSKMLQIEEEQTRLIRAIGGLEATGNKKPKIVIEFLENASLNEIDKALHARKHDILHISGHGSYHASENKGVLYFENDDGDEDQINGAELGEALRKHACVKLVVLSACETAVSGSEGGVAQQLAEYGVPAIVSMRFSITDEGAKTFTTELYTQLTKGLSITAAVAYARDTLYRYVEQKREETPDVGHIAEWFTPVTYLNQGLGPLVDLAKPYAFPDEFYPQSSFLKTRDSRLIGEGLIGRKRYLIQMRKAFQTGRHICLHGLGGLGKTTLAEAFAHNYDNRSHEVHIFRKDNEINEHHILKYLNDCFSLINEKLSRQLRGRIEDPLLEITKKLQLLIDNYLQGCKTILVFDNMEDVQKSDGDEYQRGISNQGLREFLQYLCKEAPEDCHIIFTTRYKIYDLDNIVDHLALDKLGYAEQYRLLNYSGHLRGIPTEEREKIYKRLDGHPRGYQYLEALLKKDNQFNWQQVSETEEQIFENLLLYQVYNRLNDQEKDLFPLVAMFISRTPLAALASVVDRAEADLLPVLNSFQDWSLCFVEKEGNFEVHSLTQEWIKRYITPPDNLKEWARKAAVYFEAQPTLGEYELAKSYYEIAEAWDDFVRISFRIQGHYNGIGMNQQALDMNQQILDRNISEESKCIARNNKGFVLLKIGRNDEAISIFERNLAFCQSIKNYKIEAVALNGIGEAYILKSEIDTAIQYLEKSLAITSETNSNEEAITLNNISSCYMFKNENNTALRYLENSLAVSQRSGFRQTEGNSLNRIGQLYSKMGYYDTAMTYLEKSLAIRLEENDLNGESATLKNISTIYKERRDYDIAMRYLEKSLTISKNLGNRMGEANILNSISQIYHDKCDYGKALCYLKKSLQITKEIGNRQGELIALSNISQIYQAKNEYDTTLLYLEESLVICREIEYLEGEVIVLNNIGQIHKLIGNYDIALHKLKNSLSISNIINYESGMALAMYNMGKIYMNHKNDAVTAISLLFQSYSILNQMESPDVLLPKAHLEDIVKNIGEDRYNEILLELDLK